MQANGSEEKLLQMGGMSKVARYAWGLKDEPGQLMLLSKHELYVDESYQRSANDAKILALARDWSWVACGALIVARRDGRLFVVDGQHRLLAARRRDDIKEMPCIVFATNDIHAEAKGFLQANTLRKPITSLDKFRALIITGDENAKLVDELIRSAGRYPSTAASATSVRCLSSMLAAAKNSREDLVRIWPLITKVVDGAPLHERILMALLFLEGRMPQGESLTDRKWASRLIEIGAERLMDAINKAAAYYAAGGARVWAAGVLDALNRGLRHRLIVHGLSPESSS